MLRFIKKYPIWFGLLLLIIGPASLNVSGFCWSKPGWLSDEEQIQMAVDAVNKRGPNINYLPTYDWDKFKAYKYIHYLSKDDFLGQNPNCCKAVGLEGKPIWPASFSDYLLGSRADVIEIKYKAHFQTGEGKIITKDLVEYPVVYNCGHILTGVPH